MSGLATALTLSRQGYGVSVVERDNTPMPTDPVSAFSWDRRGAPQVRHSHALLARLHNLLRDEHPDVLSALLDAGATEIKLAERMPDTLDDRTPAPDDVDLVILAARRTTFEWVLRRAVMADSSVEIVTGRGVSGLEAKPAAVPTVTGVRLDDGSSLDADLVVAANGRRSAAPDWLRAIGVDMAQDEVEDTGIIYYSRFYQLQPGAEFPEGDRLVAGDLTYLKYGVFWGDNGTFSVTLAAADTDKALRALRDAETFESATRAIPAAAPWLDGRAEPITDVHSMAGLLNRRRRFVVDQQPLALGFYVVGDAHVCTNPIYGRGCAVGFWQAQLLGQALGAHDGDDTAQAQAFDASMTEHVIPWYEASVDSDRRSRRAQARLADIAAGRESDSEDPDAMQRSILREGLTPATRTSAVVWRSFMRVMNLLALPSSMAEPEVSSAIIAAWEQRHTRTPEPPSGPTREEMLDLLGLTDPAP